MLSSEVRSIAAHLATISGLPSDDPLAEAPGSWDRWLAVVEEHQLGAFLGAHLQELTDAGSPLPSDLQDRLRRHILRAGVDAAFRSTELVRLCERLESAVGPVALEGAALSHTLYRDAGERETSVLDLLDSSDQKADRAERILAHAGYHPQRDVPPREDRRRSLFNGTSALTVHVHVNLASPLLPRSAIVEMWRSRRYLHFPNGDAIAVLDPINAAIAHALRAGEDPIDTPLLRNIFELAWQVNRMTGSERATVRALIERWHIEERVAPAFHLAHLIFGTESIVGGPANARETWARLRLDWNDSNRTQLQRDVARRHLELLEHHPEEHLILVRAILGALRHRIAPASSM
jgi:hypothetical protein